MEELNRLFQRIYEDNVSGKISDERFEKLSGGHEAEQKDLQEKAAALQAELTGQEEQAMSLDRFPATVKRYTEVKELTPTVLNDHYNCVGVIELPDMSETNSKTA